MAIQGRVRSRPRFGSSGGRLSRVTAGLVGAILLLALPAAGIARPTAGEHRPSQTRTVTLITGDRVTVHGDQLAVRPGAGRAEIVFERYRERGHHYVIPADATSLVNRGRLDRRLFDVTALLELGYGDHARPDLPLIAVHEPRAAPTFTAAGAGVTRRLDALGMSGLHAAKGRAHQFWATVVRADGPVQARRSPPVFAPGISSIWLDGRRKLSLDISVPHIGVPAAWAAGYTGAGLKAAVLDSGIDQDHPDFAGRIVEVRNFTDAVDANDDFGHGTHVASILAGSGAASGGAFRGVAPDAELLIGKVCPASFCPESSILAGMSWAAHAGADVVNMSLGGPDTPGLDPLEHAVNDLTAETGSLFVIAAGNDGESAPVSSPASADAALAVGSVDRDDAVADSSSRGPRVGDLAIKPDLTAPGVDIVAARASDGFIGEPVNDSYTRLSGTSMATPHTAGAALLLAQQHSDWSATQVKAALMASAQPHPSFDVFDEGAGRVDVAGAIEQAVVTTPTSVSLGLQPFPHEDDDVLAREVTYQNLGPNPVELDLALDVTGPDGLRAPTAMFDAQPDILAVPAGGEATATLTVDTRISSALGVFSGALVATGDGASVRTPLAVEKEAERYNLTIKHVDRDGAVADDYTTHVQGVDSFIGGPHFDPDGTLTLRLPAGRYHLFSVIHTPAGGRADVSGLADPLLELDRDTEIVFDARATRPMRVRVPERSAASAAAVVLYERIAPDGLGLLAALASPDLEHVYTAHVGEAAAEHEVISGLHSQWGRAGAQGTFMDSPFAYHLAWFQRGRYWTGFEQEVRRSDLAVVRGEYRTPMPGRIGLVVAGAFPPEGGVGGSGLFFPFRLPFERTEYYLADDTRWQTEFQTADAQTGIFETVHLKPLHALRPGHASSEVWGRAVYGPAFPEVKSSPSQWVYRHPGEAPSLSAVEPAQDSDAIAVSVPVYNDFSEDHEGFSREDSGRTALYLDGELIGETDRSGLGDFAVPDTEGQYRLEISGARPSYAELSTEVSATWRFRSRHVPDAEFVPLPVMAIRFGPTLDKHNAAPAGRAFSVPVWVQRQARAPSADVRDLAVEVSYNDGATWRPVQLAKDGDRWRALLFHPADADFVSLRATASDSAANSVEQTILRAYRLTAR